jgi:hypothetical protein
MKRKSQTPIAIPPDFRPGASIDLSTWYDDGIAVDTYGNIHCFIGYRYEDQRHDLPYYSLSVALRDKDGRGSHRFVKLRRGTLFVSSFLRDEEHYKHLENRLIILPRGASSYFGIISRENQEEDLPLTRAIFGGTAEEIETVAIAVAEIAGREVHQLSRLPRVTFSKTNNNRCDFTGCMIPKEFPYIAFEESMYDWSHVSLYGFYRLLAFLCPVDCDSPFKDALINRGISKDLLSNLIANSEGNLHPIHFPERG